MHQKLWHRVKSPARYKLTALNGHTRREWESETNSHLKHFKSTCQIKEEEKNSKEQKSIKTERKLTIEKNQQTLNCLFEN